MLFSLTTSEKTGEKWLRYFRRLMLAPHYSHQLFNLIACMSLCLSAV